MRTHANTLYVQTDGSVLGKDGETVYVKVDGNKKLNVPLHHLQGIVCFGRVFVSPDLMAECAERDVSISFMSRSGRFQSRVMSAVSGNVLLRREQYRRADRPEDCLCVARPIIAAKIQNCRLTLLRARRESSDEGTRTKLRRAADRLACSLKSLPQAMTMNEARGCEGESARVYFDSFDLLIRQQKTDFQLSGRSRRPPTDKVNALLSFAYSVLTHDAASALEGVGLDPAVGFLHVDRPGRLSLALDLVEEFRPLVADRMVLSLINLKQVQAKGFTVQPGGPVVMDDATRRTVLAAFAERKKQEVLHPLLKEKMTFGLLPHVQARLLARFVRGEIGEYPALVLK